MPRTLLGLLPYAVGTVIWVSSAGRLGEWRRALLYATVLTGSVVYFSIELASATGWLRPLPLAVFWTALLLSAVASVHGRGYPWASLAAGRRLIGPFALSWLGVEFLVLTVLAVASPPNTYDAMTYHLSRVVHWISNGSVDHYATQISRQLFNAPFAEYAITHSMLLSGDDRWANLPQLVAAVVTVVAATVLARYLGLPPRQQVWVAVLTATIPMLVAQAPSTHNDAVLMMWVVVTAALVAAPPDLLYRWPHVLAVTGAAGLAFATKGTAFFFIPPLLVWYAARVVKATAWARWMSAMTALGFGVLLFNVLTWWRNHETYGVLLAPSNGHVRPELSVSTLLENTVRDIGLQLGVPLGSEVNGKIAGALSRLLELLGQDANDRASTPYTFIVQFGTREDSAGNLAHFLLILAALGLLAAQRRLRTFLPVLACVAAGFTAIALLAGWTPYGNRYLLALFVMLMPVVAVALDRIPSWLRVASLCGVCVSASFWLVYSDLRPLVGPRSVLVADRSDQYFVAAPHLQESYQELATLIRRSGADRVGLIQGIDSWEYPLWALTNGIDGRPRFTPMNVSDASARYREEPPSLVVCTVECQPGPDYRRLRSWEPVSLWSTQR